MQRPDPDDRVLNGADTPDGGEPCVLIGRPPIGPQIHFCVTPETHARIGRLAADAGWTRAETGRYLVEWGFAALDCAPASRMEQIDHDAAIEAQAAARGMTPAELLGSAWAGLAKRGGR